MPLGDTTGAAKIDEKLRGSEDALNRRHKKTIYEAFEKWIEEGLIIGAGGMHSYTKEKDARSDVVGTLGERAQSGFECAVEGESRRKGRGVESVWRTI